MSKRMLFVFNPFSGKEKIKNKLADIIRIFSASDYEVTVYPTGGRKDAVRITREKAKEYDLIVCSGGDGTINEVVTGMMTCDKKIPIGYIPAGSTNDFASSLGLPKDMLEAARIVVSGSGFSCDIGAFNTSTFVYIAAFGIFTDVSYETPQSYKNTLGHIAYILEGIKRLSDLRFYHISVETGSDVFEGDYLFGMVTNATSVGGFKNITGRNVELNDGLFEVTLIKVPGSILELNELMAALVVEDIQSPSIISVKTDRVVFRSEENIAWTLDGEFGGDHRLAEIVCRKEAVEMIVAQ